MRSEVGLGIGHQPYEEDDLSLSYVIGSNYIRDDFASGDREEDIGLTWALDYNQKLFERGLRFYHEHDLALPYTDAGAYLLETETGFKMPIISNIDGTFKIEFDWDNNPALGAEKGDTQYTLGLGYSW